MSQYKLGYEMCDKFQRTYTIFQRNRKDGTEFCKFNLETCKMKCKFNLEIYVLDNKHANNYHRFICVQLLLFLLYIRVHSSSVEHQNIRLKLQLKGNSALFFKGILLGFVTNKISNKYCFHLPKS